MKKKIIIIGAGINGLMCAYHLLKTSNFDIEVYDKQSIPNPQSASYGKHRLIHPWTTDNKTMVAQKALAALEQWKTVLNDIDSEGFKELGAFAMSSHYHDYSKVSELDVELLSTDELLRWYPMKKDAILEHIYYFRQFGVLFADKILADLSYFLHNNGVRLHEGKAVISVNSQSGEVQFANGKVASGYQVIVAAGYESGKLLKSSFSELSMAPPIFTPMRCYVVYTDSPTIKNIDRPAWISLGNKDMWGIPSIKGIPMKLGCGDFTRPCSPEQSNEEAQHVAQGIIDKYIELFPEFDKLEVMDIGVNHWAKIDSKKLYIKIDKVFLITSDNGAGFKFSSEVASDLVNSICEL